MSFADNLVYLRQHYGITQEGLAEQLTASTCPSRPASPASWSAWV